MLPTTSARKSVILAHGRMQQTKPPLSANATPLKTDAGS